MSESSKITSTSKAGVSAIIDAYDALVRRAVEVTNLPLPENESRRCSLSDMPRLRLDPHRAILTWREYESDYYGGGCCVDATAEIKLHLLTMSDEEFAKHKLAVELHATENAKRLRKARDAVKRAQNEAQDRAEYARLKAKYEKKSIINLLRGKS